MHFFWQRHPALFYGLIALLTVNFFIFQKVWLLFALLIVLFTSSLSFSLLGFLFSVGFFLFLNFNIQFPKEEGMKGSALFEIEKITLKNSSFGKKWVYQGTLKAFIPEKREDSILKNIPISLNFPEDWERPKGDSSYRFSATLKKGYNDNYYLKIVSGEPWYPIKNSFSLAEIRYQLKSKVTSYIKKSIPDKTTANFLAGIATGDFDDRMLSLQFSRFGLQHIMAISGFHFTILSAFLMLFLRFFLSLKKVSLIALLLLTLYFLFLGPSSSVLRSYLMIALSQLAFLLKRRNASLNALGGALLISLIFDPFFSQTLGFQFSFGATASILLLFKPIDEFLQKAFKKRHLSEALEMDFTSQHFYCLLTFFRQG